MTAHLSIWSIFYQSVIQDVVVGGVESLDKVKIHNINLSTLTHQTSDLTVEGCQAGQP